PAKKCRSPFREDKNPSFSVYMDGRRCRDFGTGQDWDVIAFFAEAKGCTQGEAIRQLAERLGGASGLIPAIVPRASVARPVDAEVVPYELTKAEMERMAAAAHRLASDPALYQRVLGERPE